MAKEKHKNKTKQQKQNKTNKTNNGGHNTIQKIKY